MSSGKTVPSGAACPFGVKKGRWRLSKGNSGEVAEGSCDMLCVRARFDSGTFVAEDVLMSGTLDAEEAFFRFAFEAGLPVGVAFGPASETAESLSLSFLSVVFGLVASEADEENALRCPAFAPAGASADCPRATEPCGSTVGPVEVCGRAALN
jgi:hypothetical protein